MPKSKRNKIVHLTKVKKKGKDHVEELKKQIEEYVTKFRLVYLFDFDQTKSDLIMKMRLRFKGIGRVFAGRNSAVVQTLQTIGKRTNTNFDDLIEQVNGHRGLLFTDMENEAMVQLLDEEQPEFLKKLQGYAHIAPETEPMEVDSDKKSPSKKTVLKKAKKRSGEKRQVKFVKI